MTSLPPNDAQAEQDPFNRKQVEAICRAVCDVEGLDPDDITWAGDDPPWTRYADAVATALSQPSPAATVGPKSAPVVIASHEGEGLPSSDAAGAGADTQCSADNWDEEGKRIEKDFYAKVGRYCTFGPPAERKRQWIILFEDADKGVMVFENEREAHTAWDRAKDNWTCTLYETAHRKFVFAAGQLRPINEPQPTPESVIAVLAKFHRNSCYPQASDGELRIYADEILALSRPKPSTDR